MKALYREDGFGASANIPTVSSAAVSVSSGSETSPHSSNGMASIDDQPSLFPADSVQEKALEATSSESTKLSCQAKMPASVSDSWVNISATSDTSSMNQYPPIEQYQPQNFCNSDFPDESFQLENFDEGDLTAACIHELAMNSNSLQAATARIAELEKRLSAVTQAAVQQCHAPPTAASARFESATEEIESLRTENTQLKSSLVRLIAAAQIAMAPTAAASATQGTMDQQGAGAMIEAAAEALSAGPEAQVNHGPYFSESAKRRSTDV
jgi:hypothetical protein